MIRKSIPVLVSCILFIVIGCNRPEKKQTTEQLEAPKEELSKILEQREINVVVDYNSTNYFVYRGRPMGFQYELLRHLAKDLNVELKLTVSNSLIETFDGLYSGRFDLIAKNLTITKERAAIVDFTKSLTQTRQVLVQRKPQDWRELNKEELEKRLVRNQLDLGKKSVVVQRNTAYYQRLINLSDEIGAPINIIEDTIYGVERLVALVSKGDIDYTVCDENVAKVNQSYYPNIDIKTPVSFSQKIAWAVRKDEPELLDFLNNWIVKFRETKEYTRIYNKYFLSTRANIRMGSDYHSMSGGKLSPYDDVIKELAEREDLDWKLLASIIYQESRFDPQAESWAGAVGLMQLMPETADQFDVGDLTEPRENISGGIRLLNWLMEQVSEMVPNEDEQLKFVLASYNVGLGHVKDARRLAVKYGKDPNVWDDNVDFFLLNKSASKYYKDPVVKWGYCRGEEPYEYVNKVLDIYNHYTNILD
ncbi:transporter substrate-binding domain-containing protein [Puteibacter caeruleilacunae]|nr:transporter substrate-binding domain-containing protein [Puteibacter caeruleilacunae]